MSKRSENRCYAERASHRACLAGALGVWTPWNLAWTTLNRTARRLMTDDPRAAEVVRRKRRLLQKTESVRLPLAVLIVVALAAVLGVDILAQAAEPSIAGCGLLAPDSDAALSRDCLVCHGSFAHGGHPYDLDLGHWKPSGRGGALRPASEMRRRGAFLPDGEIRCVTCHDRVSPWKFHIRLPPGSKPTHAVNPHWPATYDERAPLPQPRAGDDVGRKPLCLACHAFD